jgi:hypothetical protein
MPPFTTRRVVAPLLALTVLGLVVPRDAAACTVVGPGADEFYAALSRPAYIQWAISILPALIWLWLGQGRRGHVWGSVVLCALAVFHPAWMMRGDMGDCGGARQMFGFAVNAISLGLLVGLWRSRRRTFEAAA